VAKKRTSARNARVGFAFRRPSVDPGNRDAFEKWLASKPPSWSVVIAARAALRLLPLIGPNKISARNAEILVLPIFRASAIARFAAVYPNRATGARAVDAADAAADAASDTPAATVVTLAARAAASALATAFAARAAAAAFAARAVVAAPAVAFAAPDAAAAFAAVGSDVLKLDDGGSTPKQLGCSQLWPGTLPESVASAWQKKSAQLRNRGSHWLVWIDWYDGVLGGSPSAPQRSEAWEMAFTDIEHPLPWDEGAEAVNTEIATRLARLKISESRPLPDEELAAEQTRAELAEVASPQPSLTQNGRLDAGPNATYDAPLLDDDLATLPIRQRNLIMIILDDLPRNAPRHLGMCLHSYGEELKARGVQPILGLLKDMADVIAAAVAAPLAEDEWLEPGVRQLFTSFRNNHDAIVQHFPLDPKREKVFDRIPVNEAEAAGAKLAKPFEEVAASSNEARRAGLTTDDFVAVVEKMTEFARVVSTQPTNLAPPAPASGVNLSPEIQIDPADRPRSVTVKKRIILSALGFFERAYNLAGSSASIATTDQGAHLIKTLWDAITSLSSFVG
jgi:hypothetical protein